MMVVNRCRVAITTIPVGSSESEEVPLIADAYTTRIQLVIIRTQFDGEFKNSSTTSRTSRWFIDFVDYNDREQGLVQGFQYETGLRHGFLRERLRPIQPISHFHDPFHFSTRVCVSWCVHDIDSSFRYNGCIFSKDRDHVLSRSFESIARSLFFTFTSRVLRLLQQFIAYQVVYHGQRGQ